MGLSLAERFARLPLEKRLAWLAEQPLDVLQQITRGEWWWTSRPEQVPPPGDWFIHLALAGRGWGKLVEASELIATACVCQGGCMIAGATTTSCLPGFTKLSDIQVGDYVYDEAGRPTRVTATFDAIPEVAYRLHFSDGTHIDACSDHQWVTWDHPTRKAYLRTGHEGERTQPAGFPEDWPTWLKTDRWGNPTGIGAKTLTTQQVVDTLTFGKRGDTNHCIPLTEPLQTPWAVLPIDPWLLGYWLGNGAAGSGGITAHAEDRRYVEGRASTEMRFRYSEYGASSVGYVRDLIPRLRDLGVLGNKHVPHQYLWASIEQRTALLQGLMDSDGYGEKSKVEFSSMSRELADAVMFLARSLGQKPSMSTVRAKLNSVDKGEHYRVSWRPTFNPFGSPRKRATYVPPQGQALRNKHRMIVKAERIDPVPMRCLTVDSPNHMFLVGEALIPTHNSRAGSEWLVGRTQDHPTDKHGTPTEWLVIAETLADARTICVEGPAGLLRVLERRGIKYKYIKHPKPMILVGEHSTKIYFEGADDADVGRGYNAAGAWLDEIAKWRYLKASWEEGIMPSLRADLLEDHPRVFVTTTPKPVDLIREWVARKDGSISLVRGSTFDNRANLSAMTLAEMEKRYAGTLIGRQELYGELIESMDGALFKFSDIENARVSDLPELEVSRVCAVDPALTGEDDEMGIVIASRDPKNHTYILADESTMGSGRPAALHAWRAFSKWNCDVLLYESNLGKVWMAQVLEDAYKELMKTGMFPDRSVPPMKAVDSKHGKKTRAEPVAMRYEQGRIHHVGRFELLENQLVEWDPLLAKDSPDRLDALVHAVRFLIQGERREVRIHTPTSMWIPNARSTL